MAEKSKKREKQRYSVYRLESCPKTKDRQSPETEWEFVAYFEGENDANVASKLLNEALGAKAPWYSIVREIREKEVTPKTNRKLL